MTDCVAWQEFKFCTKNKKFILGDNETIGSGLVKVGVYPQLVIIPPYVNQREVQEIGYSALSDCPLIKEIIIEARITQINQEAFWACTSLEKITIPNTCLYIFSSAIHIWNSSRGIWDKTPGTSIVIFEPNSKLAFIGIHGISYRRNIHIYLCNKVHTKLDSESIGFTDNIITFSPISFVFNRKLTNTSKYSSLCSTYRTCKYQKNTRLPAPLVFNVSIMIPLLIVINK